MFILQIFPILIISEGNANHNIQLLDISGKGDIFIALISINAYCSSNISVSMPLYAFVSIFVVSIPNEVKFPFMQLMTIYIYE